MLNGHHGALCWHGGNTGRCPRCIPHWPRPDPVLEHPLLRDRCFCAHTTRALLRHSRTGRIQLTLRWHGRPLPALALAASVLSRCAGSSRTWSVITAARRLGTTAPVSAAAGACVVCGSGEHAFTGLCLPPTGGWGAALALAPNACQHQTPWNPRCPARLTHSCVHCKFARPAAVEEAPLLPTFGLQPHWAPPLPRIETPRDHGPAMTKEEAPVSVLCCPL
ncbi:hypothetical protein GWK47_005440 [Chionoecetes opilio]|uniref:Uncharacterized protein n=1 Tax=Chionoecetes opilio TaxID=41210 RepID=A0A8J4Y9A5_CHIOP|nr:hypothetical protein GWK47_005440 [Chionoecetes opilio]